MAELALTLGKSRDFDRSEMRSLTSVWSRLIIQPYNYQSGPFVGRSLTLRLLVGTSKGTESSGSRYKWRILYFMSRKIESNHQAFGIEILFVPDFQPSGNITISNMTFQLLVFQRKVPGPKGDRDGNRCWDSS